MTKRYVDELFESLHKAEFDRKDKHETNDTFLLAVLSVLGSIGLYFVKLVPSARNDFSGWSFCLGTGLFALLFAYMAFCVIASIWPRNIAYPGEPSELWKYSEELKEFLIHPIGVSSDAVLDQVDLQLQTLMRRQYADCAANNRFVNQQKLHWQVKARECINYLFFLILVISIPTLIIHIQRDEEITKVEIKNWHKMEELRTKDEVNEKQHNAKGSTSEE